MTDEKKLSSIRDSEFEDAMDRLSLSRFRICLLIFAVLIPVLGIIDYFTEEFINVQLSIALRLLMVVVLCIYAGLSFIRQFEKNGYAFMFILMVIMGAYNLMILNIEHESMKEHYIMYALLFAIVGTVMPWGGTAVAGICFPAYLFYPLGFFMNSINMDQSFFIKSNIYLILFMMIIFVGATINHRFRQQEFLLKKRLQSMNVVLEDTESRLKRSHERIQNMAIIDQLTGVYNRTYLTQWLGHEIHKSKEAWGVFSIIMYDADKFKEVNDRCGHQMGDLLLKRMTDIVQETLDVGAQIFRYGGDEFCIILPGVDAAQALKAAEKMRLAVVQSPDLLFKVSATESIHVSLSIGVISEYTSGTIDSDYLIRWADAALLESKRAGRNCIHIFDSEKRRIVSAAEWLTKRRVE